MPASELFTKLSRHSIETKIFFSKDFITVPVSDFKKYQTFFTNSYNIMNTSKNYRSKHWFSHIHAVTDGDFVQFHLDKGNYSIFWPLYIFHLLLDVFPFLIICLVQFRNPYNFKI